MGLRSCSEVCDDMRMIEKISAIPTSNLLVIRYLRAVDASCGGELRCDK